MQDEYDSAVPRGTALAWTRVYRRGSQVSHLYNEALGYRVACDDPADPRMPRVSDGWLGTGSQEEYEKAALLRLCRKCFVKREAARFGER